SIIQPKKGQKVTFFTQNEVHHEIELGFMINTELYNKDITKSGNWQDYIAGYFLALDLTDRDYQWFLKKNSLPWDLAKGQNNFLPLSTFVSKTQIRDPYSLILDLQINGKTVQKDSTGNMHFKIDQQISFAIKFMTLNQGDLFLTGTPSGVGPIKNGDEVFAQLLDGDKVLAQIHFFAEIVKSSL
ncbi:hypothetical protein IMG5_196060, partial [Ichthyophthirius multifiliis]